MLEGLVTDAIQAVAVVTIATVLSSVQQMIFWRCSSVIGLEVRKHAIHCYYWTQTNLLLAFRHEGHCVTINNMPM